MANRQILIRLLLFVIHHRPWITDQPLVPRERDTYYLTQTATWQQELQNFWKGIRVMLYIHIIKCALQTYTFKKMFASNIYIPNHQSYIFNKICSSPAGFELRYGDSLTEKLGGAAGCWIEFIWKWLTIVIFLLDFICSEFKFCSFCTPNAFRYPGLQNAGLQCNAFCCINRVTKGRDNVDENATLSLIFVHIETLNATQTTITTGQLKDPKHPVS